MPKVDPVTYHIWHNMIVQIENLLEHIFRGLKLITIAKTHQIRLIKLEEQLNEHFKIQSFDESALDKLLIYIQELLSIDFKDRNSNIDPLKTKIFNLFQQFRLAKQSGLDTITNQRDETAQFQTKIRQPLKKQTKEMYLVQSSFLSRLNKRQFQVDELLWTQKLYTTESAIVNKIQQAIGYTESASQRLRQLNKIPEKETRLPEPSAFITSAFITSQPMTERLNNSSRRNSSSLHSLIKAKIFQKKPEISTKILLYDDKRLRIKKQIEHYLQKQNQTSVQSQRKFSNYLALEKTTRQANNSQYFKGYMDQRNKNSSKLTLSQIIGLSSQHVNKKPLLRLEKPLESPVRKLSSPTKGQRSRSLCDIIKPLEYKDKIRQSKLNKIFLGVQMNSVIYLKQCGYQLKPEDYNGKDELGNTPLYYGVKQNLYDMCSYLLLSGSNPNLQCEKGYTALHMAYMIQSQELIELLIENGADPNLKNDLGQYPRDAQDMNPVKEAIMIVSPIQSPKYQDFLEY